RSALQQGGFAQAEPVFREILQAEPNDAEALSFLAAACLGQGKTSEAVALYQRLLSLAPESAEAYCNLGVAYAMQGLNDEAAANYSLGNALQKKGLLDEAVASYEQALRLRPDYAQAHYNRALARLLTGDFAHGWPEYEWRWKCKGFYLPPFTQPFWDGSPLKGRTILLHAEQGLGDTLHFIRYAGLVKRQGATVLFECQKPLMPLLARTPGIDQMIPLDSELPPFDVHAPLFSLPRLLGTTLATIPANVPYLFADEGLVEKWRGKLKKLDGFKVGIAWQGDPTHQEDRQRSIPLRFFA